MINFIKTRGAGLQLKLEISTQEDASANWITVFISENGGRKSLLLRCLAEAALGNKIYISPNKSRIEIEPAEALPDKIIAISGTPLDRFPRSGTSDLRSKRKAVVNNNRFVYLGQRSSNGMSGLAQSERSLIGSLISNRHYLKVRSSQLKRVFQTVGLEAEIKVCLRTANHANPLETLKKSGFLEQSREIYEQHDESPHKSEIMLAINRLDSLIRSGRIDRPLNAIRSGKAVLTIVPDRITSRFGLTVAAWELLIQSGLAEITGSIFRRKRSHLANVHGDQLSSGQWSWLGSFGALVAELRDHSLILIDEPENSLHPSWERQFMPELQQCLNGLSGCQVVVATHSPLITSGVSPEHGNIRTLKRASRVDAITRSEPIENAFGWNASDVYDGVFGLESTRNPKFLSNADDALRAIASGKNIPIQKIERWIAELSTEMKYLPKFDPMKAVFSDIISSLNGNRANSERTNKK